jgi:hypothetical protein
MSADELARATATQLHEEFATIVRTSELANVVRLTPPRELGGAP